MRVVDGPRKAYLGIGFEERSDAFEFGVCLQEIRRHNSLEKKPNGLNPSTKNGVNGNTGGISEVVPKKDYSLKEGETISITIGVSHKRPPKILS